MFGFANARFGKKRTDSLSALDIDIAIFRGNRPTGNLNEAIIDFNNQELAYEMSLNAAAKIIQPTLMNFLN